MSSTPRAAASARPGRSGGAAEAYVRTALALADGFLSVWDEKYRSRLVRESRTLLREMGLDLPDSIEIRVVDTSAETRFMVMPLRPAGTEGWTEEQLAAIVTKKVLIGVEMPQVPQ